MESSYKHFKELLLRHSVERPPKSAGIFTKDDVKTLNDYVLNRFVVIVLPVCMTGLFTSCSALICREGRRRT